MIIIQASNIHQGGGSVLLNELLSVLDKKDILTRVYIDSRFKQCNEYKKIEFVKVNATIFNRLKVEWCLASLAKKNLNFKFIFFGNLPPLFKSNHQSYLFFQNVILLRNNDHFKFSLLTKIKHSIERLWLTCGIKNIKTTYVQSETVKKNFLSSFPESVVKVLPFMGQLQSFVTNLSQTKTYDFVYVATADPHKNQTNLIKAWCYLFDQGVTPKLTLTTKSFCESDQALLNQAIKKGVNIELKDSMSHSEVCEMYRSAKALVYPSFAESFGLPLLEAQSCGLPIIASEKDYVRDLVNPSETFDPNSEVSIARAVQRFLKITESGKSKVVDAGEFLNQVLNC